MYLEAIQKDVSANTEVEAATDQESSANPVLTPRQEAMQSVISKRKDEMSGELEDALGAGSVEPDEEVSLAAEGDTLEISQQEAAQEASSDTDMEPNTQSQAAQDLTDALGIYRNEEGQQVAKMKINGEEREIPAEQVKAMLQKELSGDLKLQQAFERERRLQEYEQDLKTEAERLRSLTPQQLPDGAVDEDSKAKASSFIDELIDGDPVVAKQQLAELFAGRREPTLDMDSLSANAAERAVNTLDERQYADDARAGLKTLNTEYGHIMQDPQLRSMADVFTEEIERSDPTLSPSEIMVKAAKKTDQWVANLRGDKPGNSAGESRSVDKSNLKTLPTGRSAAHQPPKKEQVDTSPAGVISRMARRRAGQ